MRDRARCCRPGGDGEPRRFAGLVYPLGDDQEMPSLCSATPAAPFDLARAVAGGVRPGVDHLQFAGQILVAAEAPLHFAARGDRQRRLANQDDRVGIDFVVLDDRAANRLHDLVPVGVAELPIDLVDDHEPLGAEFSRLAFSSAKAAPISRAGWASSADCSMSCG